jgi:hypothetical protein
LYTPPRYPVLVGAGFARASPKTGSPLARLPRYILQKYGWFLFEQPNKLRKGEEEYF